MVEKFTECSALVLPPAAIAETLQLLDSIGDLPDLRALVRVLTTVDFETSTALPA